MSRRVKAALLYLAGQDGWHRRHLRARTVAGGIRRRHAGETDMPSVEDSSSARRRHARVLAVDDDLSFLTLLCDVVEAASELELVGKTDCGESAVESARSSGPTWS